MTYIHTVVGILQAVYYRNMSAKKPKTPANYPPVTIYQSRWLKYPNTPLKESRKKKRQASDAKDHQDFFAQFYTACKYGESQQEIKREVEKEARDEPEVMQLATNPKQMIRNRQKRQQVAFHHLAAILEKEESQKAQKEQRRHAQAVEKERATEAERKKQMGEQKEAMVEMKRFNTYIEEKKRQRDLWERKIRNDWIVEEGPRCLRRTGK